MMTQLYFKLQILIKYKLQKVKSLENMNTNKNKIDKICFHYDFIKMIGQGSYGSVFLCQRKERISNTPFNDRFIDSNLSSIKYCAIKAFAERLQDNQGLDFSTLRQINLMLTANNAHIAKAYQVYYNLDKIHMVMDFYIDLADVIHNQKQMSAQLNKRSICYQITNGLAYLHRNYIMHRDLKPQNIFIDQYGTVKIGDFGMIKQFGTPNKKFTPYVCTRQYRAPELYLQTNYYTEKADIWSLGCIFYYIYTGKNLFYSDSKTTLGIVAKIFSITGTPNQTNWPGYKSLPKTYQFQPYAKKNIAKDFGVPEPISQLIEMCLNLDPKKRPSAEQLLRHQFFNTVKDKTSTLQIEQIHKKKLHRFLNPNSS